MVWIGLEGCDGVGKSSIAEAVYNEVKHRVAEGTLPPGDVQLLHRGPPERSVIEEYAYDVEGHEDVHYVFDRWHLGTLVYAPLYRGTGPYGELGLGGFRWVEKFLQARGATFYVCDLPYETVKARLEARGEDYLQSHHVEHVLSRFREVQKLSAITAPLFDLPETLDGLPSLAHEIVQDAAENAEQHEPLRAFPSYVGGINPTALLVGEKRGGKPPFASQACFGPVPNRSGEYLWEALPDPLWREVGVANAYEDDIPALWDVLGKPPIVALGSAASKALNFWAMKHALVPHPQKIKRFYNKMQREYGFLIQRAIGTDDKVLTWPK